MVRHAIVSKFNLYSCPWSRTVRYLAAPSRTQKELNFCNKSEKVFIDSRMSGLSSRVQTARKTMLSEFINSCHICTLVFDDDLGTKSQTQTHVDTGVIQSSAAGGVG
ncbi:hypothetical protein HELRODRAFT_163755 [Helobdella robusta]|uniref:Uncharacterized protein n=1 Tax=Helobdella robusta TaxID=6412 RepID=T1EUF2_HELRO|nr:hypothetical protein HELRODRAFT_163755 [Helobdella robusta]ESN96661.1 hypothetical protein HELRODRAFT_163755 [Helobdella robusta]